MTHQKGEKMELNCYYPGEEVKELVGKTLTSVEAKGSERLVFEQADGYTSQLLHHQDCCEDVRIEDIAGDLAYLVGSEILMAEESTSEVPEGESQDQTDVWTFYKFRTQKGDVTVRFRGQSNGYHGVEVSYEVIALGVGRD